MSTATMTVAPQRATRPRSAGNRRVWVRWGLRAALAAGAVFMLVPFVLMVLAAVTPDARLKPGSAAVSGFTLSNFRQAWQDVDWPGLYLNTVVVVVVVFAAQVLTSLPAGYALARLRFRNRKLSFWVVMVCLAIPPQVTGIPVFYALSQVDLLDSYTALVLPSIGSAFGIFLFRQFVLSLPQSVFDAARLDRTGPIAMVWRIVLPNVKPALAAFAVFTVVGHWNDLFWPSVLLRSDRVATVPYGIARYAAPDSLSSYGTQMAAATLAALPLLIFFLFVQRQLVRGIAFTNGGE
ncbi:carbohydrate ABC transporter permease [Saccharopolyspora pogona]|uniref:carbohydrate ABC transporter permease n=1 Tax=Saccharopolyspora pogona TaxID=333966 RepID=UPI0016870F0B|nr:carbohydrate ABC transporter permease [Saccharopolyspora pogona]